MYQDEYDLHCRTYRPGKRNSNIKPVHSAAGLSSLLIGSPGVVSRPLSASSPLSAHRNSRLPRSPPRRPSSPYFPSVCINWISILSDERDLSKNNGKPIDRGAQCKMSFFSVPYIFFKFIFYRLVAVDNSIIKREIPSTSFVWMLENVALRKNYMIELCIV